MFGGFNAEKVLGKLFTDPGSRITWAILPNTFELFQFKSKGQ